MPNKCPYLRGTVLILAFHFWGAKYEGTDFSFFLQFHDLFPFWWGQNMGKMAEAYERTIMNFHNKKKDANS